MDVRSGIDRLITKQSRASIVDFTVLPRSIANEIISRGENLSKRWREQLARQTRSPDDRLRGNKTLGATLVIGSTSAPRLLRKCLLVRVTG